MGGKKTEDEEGKKKKKGRPSLLDLQKRSLRLEQQQQQQQQQQNNNQRQRNPNPSFRNPTPAPAPVRRSTRRNPVVDSDRNDDEEDEESTGKRREKKLKLVLRLPPRTSPANSEEVDSDDGSSRSDDSNEGTPRKERKINAFSAGDGSRASGSEREKAGRHNSGLKGTKAAPGTPLDSGPATPLPDKKLLVFILDRLQKKDTYGVFSEPVDPNELPDYHEVIEHPMDFGTVRKKLSSGAYANLEQFEKDVFLISSNAMRYNAPDTIYFRQARSIQELAKKDFENLRQDSEENEPEIKTVRRGRPPGKASIKRVGRPSFEHPCSDFSDATLATIGENSVRSNSALDFSRRTQHLEKSAAPDGLARASSRTSDNHVLVADRKPDRTDEFPGSTSKGLSKFGKKTFVLDENRRNTYKQAQQLGSGTEPSVFTAFDGDKKQLMAVGVHMEHAYARSLARFAANLSPIAWKVASKKIEKALPSGMKFGPGWVGDNEAPQIRVPSPSSSSPQQRPPPHSQSPSEPKTVSNAVIQALEPQPERSSEKTSVSSTSSPQQPPLSQNSSQPKTSANAVPHVLELKSDKSMQKQEPLNESPSYEAHPSGASTSTSTVTNRPGPGEGAEMARGIHYGNSFNLLSGVSGFRPRHPFHLSQSPAVRPPVNGFSSYAFGIPSQPGKLVGSVGLTTAGGNFGPALPPQLMNASSRSTSNTFHPMPFSHSEAEDSKLAAAPNSTSLVTVGPSGQVCSGAGLQPQPSWRGKPDSVPPDLNVRFQSPGSPTSGVSQQPDLALQL